MLPPFSGSPEKALALMLATSGDVGENWQLNLLTNRSCRQFYAAAVPCTSRIFLRGSEGESAGSEQFFEDANRNKTWTSLIRLSQPFCFFAACCATRDASLTTADHLYVAVTKPSLMFVDCGELLGRRHLREPLSFGCTGTELRTDISISPQVASHRNWRGYLECKQGLDLSCCEESENWTQRGGEPGGLYQGLTIHIGTVQLSRWNMVGLVLCVCS